MPPDNVNLEEDPEVLGMFSEWANKQEEPLLFEQDRVSEEPWFSKAAHAFILATKLRASKFERYALSQFIQNCAMMPFGPWAYIESEAPLKSSLRRFSSHWIAWNVHLAGGRAGEFDGLQAVGLAISVTDYARDPRVYDLDHWYSPCGDLLEPGCAHDPITREERLRNESKPPPEPVREVGRSFEEKRLAQNFPRRS
jgi:hypothetical protein